MMFLFATFHDVYLTEVANQCDACQAKAPLRCLLKTWPRTQQHGRKAGAWLHSGFRLRSLIWIEQSKLQELSMKTFQAQHSNSLTIYLACLYFFKWNDVFILSGGSDSGLGKCSSSVGLCNSPALLLCSSVALTPGQHLKLGPGPVCSGRVYAFQRSSDRNGCSWRNRSPASGPRPSSAHAGLFTVKRTHLLGLAHVWPGRLWYTHAFIRILLITDGRL